MKITSKIFKLSIGFAFIFGLNFNGKSQSNTPCSAGVPTAPGLTVGTTCTTTAGTTVSLAYASNAANGGTPSCGSPGAPDGWYQFTAPANGTVTISTYAGTMTDGVMSLYGGSCGSWTELACNDNGFGMPSITYSSLTPGAVYMIRIWSYFSGTGTFSICITTPSGATDPCASITNIAACGSSVTANLSGTGGGWSITACGYTTSGDEQIYSFTPATTGTYSLNVTTASGGFIDYFWINSTAGCSSGAAWNCIDDVFSTGTYGAMSWTAGQTYYILLDPEGSGAYTATFSVNCVIAASDPCASITNIGACGTSVTANMSGTGASWSVGACGFTTPGDEVIYSFTPATTGTYTLNVSAVTNGYVDTYFANSSGGCSSAAAWSCIDDIFSPGTYGSMSLTAGQTYYFLLDPENTLGSSMTFSIACPTGGTGPCATPTNIVGCGASYSGTLSGTGSWLSNPCGFTTSGVEIVYAYTATSTGNHVMNFTSITGGFIDVGYQASSCSSTGWTCIDDVIATGNTPSFNLTAGTTYYFILDPEGTGTYTYTFYLDCPGTVVTASDCPSAVNICDNASFQIDPNGYGASVEIPALGTIGNPDNNNPGGSGNWGCLRSGTIELNSTWMIINIATSGNLEFSFGAGGAQSGFYDWIMYPYSGSSTCTQIPTGNYAPVRCNWNGSSTGGTGCAAAGNIPAGGVASNYEVPLPVTAGQQYIICFSNYSSAVTSVPLDFFGTAQVSCTALPVELINFNGYAEGENNVLRWTSATELNTAHYITEYSYDGINFAFLGQVEAQGGSTITSYSFIHSNPQLALTYYRLRAVDYDNMASQSGIINIERGAGNILEADVYPNPAENEMNLEIISPDEINVIAEITDISGKIIHRQIIQAEEGRKVIELNTSNWKDGMYFMQLKNEKEDILTIKKFLINR